MGRKLLTLRYDGTNYHGWQVQKNGITVQQALQDAMERLLLHRPDVTGCSRTDAGVHANMFCCHFDTDSKIPNQNIIMSLNLYLPQDIAVLNCQDIHDNFHARYDCKAKNYIYKIYESEIRNPFYNGYALQSKKRLDLDKMHRFCQDLIGTHDFTAFSAAGRTTKTTVRTITECEFYYDRDMLIFSVTADGFLYNMVRIIVGTLLYVSLGKIEPTAASKILNSKDRTLAGPTVPGFGLYLNKVYY